MDPAVYYDACVYDACETLPDDDVICEDIAVYAEACQYADYPPENWRMEDFCRMYFISFLCLLRAALVLKRYFKTKKDGNDFGLA